MTETRAKVITGKVMDGPVPPLRFEEFQITRKGAYPNFQSEEDMFGSWLSQITGIGINFNTGAVKIGGGILNLPTVTLAAGKTTAPAAPVAAVPPPSINYANNTVTLGTQTIPLSLYQSWITANPTASPNAVFAAAAAQAPAVAPAAPATAASVGAPIAPPGAPISTTQAALLAPVSVTASPINPWYVVGGALLLLLVTTQHKSGAE